MSLSGPIFLLGLWLAMDFRSVVAVSSSASHFVRRAYEDIDPATQICTIGYHQSTMVGTTLYVDGGYIWYKNGSDHVGPNMWLRALDTSKAFIVTEVDEVPIKFIQRPPEVPEMSAGDLWTYKGSLYQRGGFPEGADTNFPGWNQSPNGTLSDFWKYDIDTNDWSLFQHNPTATGGEAIKRIRHAQSVVIESLNKAFVISGEVENDNTYAVGMKIYDFEKEIWEHQVTPWSAWSNGLANHLAIDDPGYILGLSGSMREGGRMDAIEIYDLERESWRETQTATAADNRIGIPEPRAKPCSVISRAKDGSSYNVYMFGGYSPDGAKGFAEVWILSIPSFKWFLVNTGLSSGAEVPGTYEASTCHIVGGGRKLMVYGGRQRAQSFSAKCDRTSIHVFDMTTLEWEEVYNPDDGEYEVPEEIYKVIGGGPDGRATLLPEKGMANSDMEGKFKKIIDKIKEGSTNETATSTESDTLSESTSDTESDAVGGGSKNGLAAGAIAGIVVGAVIGLSLLVFAVFWIRKRSKTKHTMVDAFPPVAELSTAPPPQELDFSPHVQELHGYMPQELGARTDDGTSYYAPAKSGGSGQDMQSHETSYAY